MALAKINEVVVRKDVELTIDMEDAVALLAVLRSVGGMSDTARRYTNSVEEALVNAGVPFNDYLPFFDVSNIDFTGASMDSIRKLLDR